MQFVAYHTLMAHRIAGSGPALALVLATLALAWGCAAAPRRGQIPIGDVESGPGSLTATRKALEGTWTLDSLEVIDAAGVRRPVKSGGQLTYDDFGNMTMEIRVDEPTALLLEGVGIRTTNGMLSTKGRTVIDLQAHTITYMLEGQPAYGAPSGPIALNRPRHWVVEGNVLTLTTKGADGMPLSVSRWEKKTPE